MMTILFAFLYVLLVIFIVGMIVLVGLGNDMLQEDPPLIKK